MYKKILLTLLLLLFFSCKNNDDDKKRNLKTKEKVINKNVIKTKKIGDFMSDNEGFTWSVKQGNSVSSDVKIVFQKEFVIYEFNRQCLYYFFTNHYYTGTDKIELIWSYKTDCLSEKNIFNVSDTKNESPKAGDRFCEFELVNDSVIHVKYNFSGWAKEINSINKDSIFPNFLYLEQNRE
ncbi:hypothetical protein SAMN06265349_102948 [Flavobacterium resistens]|uniref:Lipoprotein n=1 Tax=Flavobacterium resistens TaxID=443612 RepID=A0A521CVB0_9FLAO|nr:hypothetical protein [Flavobacterium resistens]MRX67016.1 hypothetical protein [Flavobacterium resistens]SMO63365.1 hypothetical protein SAMN06265349_102948 [Flavobacterium resistens]